MRGINNLTKIAGGKARSQLVVASVPAGGCYLSTHALPRESVPAPEGPPDNDNQSLVAADASVLGRTTDVFRHWTAWLVLAGSIIATALVVGCAVRVDPSGTASIGLLVAALLLVSRIWWPENRHRRLADAFGAVALTLIGGMACGGIAMLGLRLHFPLADNLLFAWDRALGINGVAVVDALVSQGQWLFDILSLVYNLTLPVFVLGIIVLALVGQRVEAWRAAFCFVGTLLTTCLIAMFVPAKGLGVWAPDSLFARMPVRSMRNFWPHFDQFYSGAHPVLRLEVIDGVVSFPSFHSIVGFLTVAMWRKTLVTAVPAGVWLFFLLLATFPYGGHYFVDLLGGFAVFAGWFRISRWMERTAAARPTLLLVRDEMTQRV